MGLSTVTAARILAGQLRGETGEENRLSFERFPHVALSKTYNTNQQTPDSAGTITAIATGAKTRAGVLSVDEFVDRGDAEAVAAHRLETIVEQAEQRGLATGIVTTTTVTHATPAGFYAHSPERSWESDGKLPSKVRSSGFPDIARQLVEFSHGDGLDVVLGGGEAHFRSSPQVGYAHSDPTRARLDGRDLVDEWSKRPGAVFISSCSELAALPGDGGPLLGLFSPSHMSFEADRKGAGQEGCEPSLGEMVDVAIARLARNPKGYFLMVEGGRIDHGHHVNNAFRALVDTIEFARAVEHAVRQASDATLIVVTADHGHVLTMGGYATRGNDILGLVVENDARGHPESAPAVDALGMPYTTLGYGNGPGYTGASAEQPEGPKQFPHGGRRFTGIANGRPDLSKVDVSAPSYLQEAAVPISFETHSGEDVPVYAQGPGAALFRGVVEQNYIYHAMVEALGWNQQSGD
jgi:alkaline phosphatase